MPVIVLESSPNLIEIKRAYQLQKIIGLLVMVLPIMVFVLFMIWQPERMGKTTTSKAFGIILILLLMFFLIREFYFLYIDRNNILNKDGDVIKINQKIFLLQDIDSISIIEYNGIGIMSNGFNVFIKLKNNKSIPIAIRVSEEDAGKVKIALSKFLNIEIVERKKWWIG
ncbi:MAG: hypothetical protein ACOVQE_10245 [Chitinophagaceae bacterium]